MNYLELREVNQLEEISKKSSDVASGVLIFKHSNRCAISSMVWSRFKRAWDISMDDLPIFYVDVIRSRELSNAIADKYNVRHESPQVLLVQNDECVYSTSHMDISPNNLKKVLNE